MFMQISEGALLYSVFAETLFVITKAAFVSGSAEDFVQKTQTSLVCAN